MAGYQVGQKFRVAFGKDKFGHKVTRWMAVYRCSCGKTFVMQCRSEVVTQSCGCAKKIAAVSRAALKRVEGIKLSSTRTYRSWSRMRSRCNTESNIEFMRYGGRGIRICERWDSFEAFLADMGERPIGMSIDRIDVDGDYCPENCRWATAKQQARNTRRNVTVTINENTKTVAEWCEHPDADHCATVYARLRRGVQGYEAVFGQNK